MLQACKEPLAVLTLEAFGFLLWWLLCPIKVHIKVVFEHWLRKMSSIDLLVLAA
jgi:hypothetical protein